MPRIYVSYRPQDTSRDEVQAILTQLHDKFGAENIRISEANSDSDVLRLYDEVQTYDVLLVVVGLRWLDLVDESGYRLIDSAYDYVYTEVLAALEKEGMSITVMLTDGATRLTKDDLPEALQDLADRDVVDIQHWDLFPNQAEALQNKLEKGDTGTLPSLGQLLSEPATTPLTREVEVPPAPPPIRERRVERKEIPPPPQRSAGTRRVALVSFIAVAMLGLIVLGAVVFTLNDSVYYDDPIQYATPVEAVQVVTLAPPSTPISVENDVPSYDLDALPLTNAESKLALEKYTNFLIEGGSMPELAFAPDGTLYISGTDAFARYDLNAPEESYSRHWDVGQQIRDLAVSRDGRWVVVSTSENRIKVWRDGSYLTQSVSYERNFYDIAFTLTSTDIMTVTDSGSVLGWQLNPFGEFDTGDMAIPPVLVDEMALYGDNLAYGDRNGGAFYLNEERLPLYSGGAIRGNIEDLRFAPNGHMLAGTSQNLSGYSTVWFWATNDASLTRYLASDQTIFELAWHPDGDVLALATSRDLRLIEPNRMEILTTMSLPIKGTYRIIHEMAFSPDGQFLAYSESDGTVTVLRVRR